MSDAPGSGALLADRPQTRATLRNEHKALDILNRIDKRQLELLEVYQDPQG